MKIMDILKAKGNLIAFFLCVVMSCAWIIIVSWRYYWFNSGEWDSAVHVQTLWSLAHGSLYNNLLGDNFIVEHCTFLSFIIAPLYAFFNHPLFLQYLKVLAFFSGSYLFFLILKQRFSFWLALFGMIVFSAAPANVGMLRFAFNYEPIAIPLIFLIVLSFEKKNHTIYMISCFLLCMVKEQMPLVVMGFGIWAFFCRREERIKWALYPLVMGAMIFVFEVFILIPHMRRGLEITQGYYWSRYSQWGRTPAEIIEFLLIHPQELWSRVVSTDNVHWYQELFGWTGWFAVLDPVTFIPASALFLKTMFSQRNIERSVIGCYYAATFMPFVFLAACGSAKRIPAQWRNTFVALMFSGMLIWSLTYWPLWSISLAPSTGKANWSALQKFLDEIPSNASVLTTDEALTPLSNRKHIYQLDSYLWGNYQISGRPFKLPIDLDYILIDLSEQKRLLSVNNGQQFIEKLSALNFSSQWMVKGSLEDVLLLARISSNERQQHLIQISKEPFLTGQQALETSQPVVLEDVRLGSEHERILPLEFLWRSQKGNNDVYMVQITIKKEGKSYYHNEHPAGSMLYPSSFWKKGEYIKEEYSCLLPTLTPGTYTLEVQSYNSQTHVYDARRGQWLDCIKKENGIQGKYPLYQCVPATKDPVTISKEFSVF